MNRPVDHFTLAGKRALVIAADAPAGRAVSRAFVEAGAQLALGVSIAAAQSDDLRREIGTAAANCAHFVDLSHPESVDSAVRQAAARLGGLDILICCADLFHARPLTETTDQDLNAIMATNFMVPFSAVRTAATVMRQSGSGGRIVLVSHVLGERGLPNTSAYGAAHAATQSLVRAAARELGPAGITVNAIALGWMDWMRDRIPPGDQEAERAVRFTILKRAGKPEDIGPMAVWLAGGASGFVSGQVFHLDGGLTQHI